MLFQVTDAGLKGTSRNRLSGLSFAIPQGVSAVIGFSGAGKTSLLNLLAGYESPDAGKLTFHIPDRGTTARLPLFWAPQGGGLWAHLTVEQHLLQVSLMSGGTKTCRNPAGKQFPADEILKRLDLADRRNAFPAELSQGECSRLAVARALAANSQVLVLDEPLSHVDTVRKPYYWQLIREYIDVMQVSLIFSAHDVDAVIRESRYVICLKDGRLAYQGETMTLYDAPPDQESGQMLGSLNWIERGDAELWQIENLPVEPEGRAVAIRPERLLIDIRKESNLEVHSTFFSGGCSETRLQHIVTGQQRTFMHRSGDARLQPGKRVLLRILKNEQVIPDHE